MKRLSRTFLIFMFSSMMVFSAGCTLFPKSEVPGSGGGEGEGIELIPNGGFEDLDDKDLPVGFEPNSTTGELIYVDDQVVRNGVYSVHLGADDETNQNVLHKIDVLGGKTYEFTVWYRAPEALAKNDGEVPFYARLQLYNGQSWTGNWDDMTIEPLPVGAEYDYSIKGGTGRHLLYITPHSTTRQDPNNPNDWLPLKVRFTLAHDARLFLSVTNEGTEEPVWVDDMSLKLF